MAGGDEGGGNPPLYHVLDAWTHKGSADSCAAPRLPPTLICLRALLRSAACSRRSLFAAQLLLFLANRGGPRGPQGGPGARRALRARTRATRAGGGGPWGPFGAPGAKGPFGPLGIFPKFSRIIGHSEWKRTPKAARCGKFTQSIKMKLYVNWFNIWGIP